MDSMDLNQSAADADGSIRVQRALWRHWGTPAGIYGTIVYASVVAASSGGAADQADALHVLVFSLVSIVVFWMAHVYSTALGFHAADALPVAAAYTGGADDAVSCDGHFLRRATRTAAELGPRPVICTPQECLRREGLLGALSRPRCRARSASSKLGSGRRSSAPCASACRRRRSMRC